MTGYIFRMYSLAGRRMPMSRIASELGYASPSAFSATARLAATVDLPTPPLPEATAMMFFSAPPNSTPAKPGLVREPGFAGPGLDVEVWSLPPESFGRFVAAIPAPLAGNSARTFTADSLRPSRARIAWTAADVDVSGNRARCSSRA